MADHPIISVDDHLVEAKDTWTSRFPAKYLDRAPHVIERDGHDIWVFEGEERDVLGITVSGMRERSEEVCEYGGRYADMQPGSYDPVARLADMDEDSILAMMCFPSVFGFSGTYLSCVADKELALLAVQAYNDFVCDEWCGAAPGRYIPLIKVPLWDGRLAADEVYRCAEKGARSVAFCEDLHSLGLPTIHDPDRPWDPFFTAVSETNMPLSMHIGSSSTVPRRPPNAPLCVDFSWVYLNACYSLIEWLHSGVFERFPLLKAVWSEAQIGWMPYAIEHCDRSWHTHGVWTKHPLPQPPSTYVRDHVFGTFIDDHFGIQSIDALGVDQVMIETDYPHPDGTWPHSRKIVSEQLGHLPEEDIEKICRGNAERVYGFTPSGLGLR
jgi:predicted TIM-barrel fold metal-dependent hydrolase